MTAWQSMFDGGACKVHMQRNSGSTLDWEGVLGKGDSSPVQTDSGTSNTWQVSVTSDGQVVVESDADTSYANDALAQIDVRVYPQYDCSTLQRKIDAMSGYASPSVGQYALSSNAGDSGGGG